MSTIDKLDLHDAVGEIERFRYQIYCLEQGKDLPAADHLRQRLPDSLDADGVHYIARDGGTMIGYARLNLLEVDHPLSRRAGLSGLRACGVEQVGFGSKLMVTANRRGRGLLAWRMLMEMLDDSLARGVLVGFCHCVTQLVDMYRHFGCVELPDQAWMDPTVGRQHVMLMLADTRPSGILARIAPGRARPLSEEQRQRLRDVRCALDRLDPSDLNDCAYLLDATFGGMPGYPEKPSLKDLNLVLP